MVRLFLVTSVCLALGFYQLSGGANFEPVDWRKTKPELQPAQLTEVAAEADARVRSQDAAQPLEIDLPLLLAGTPRTRRLVGPTAPTPSEHLVALGPQYDPDLVWERIFEPVEEKPAIIEIQPDFRRVTGDYVNMRTGPGTEFLVVGTLAQHSEVEILEDPGEGWVKLQELTTGNKGWMSEKMLQKVQF